MKKIGIFLSLLGATYFIYNFYAYFSGVRSLMSLLFGLLLATSLILSGLDRISHLEQTHPKFHVFVKFWASLLPVEERTEQEAQRHQGEA